MTSLALGKKPSNNSFITRVHIYDHCFDLTTFLIMSKDASYIYINKRGVRIIIYFAYFSLGDL